MKYIRTKNGKIHTLHNYQGWDNFYTCTNGWKDLNNIFYNVRKSSVVNQADTIEELCDEFVTIVDDRMPYNFPAWDAKQVKHYLHDCYDKDHCVIYGAIWTPKGLIYAAKINDKGELELL